MNPRETGPGGREGSGDKGTVSSSTRANVDQQDERLTSATPSTPRSVSQTTITDEGPCPPLPPRPVKLDLPREVPTTPSGSLLRPKSSSRPSLQATVTTGLSLTDVHTQSFPGGTRETSESTSSRKSPKDFGSIKRFKNRHGSEADESASVRSYAPTLEAGGDVESLLGEVLGASSASPAWGLLSSQAERLNPFDSISYEDDELTADFNREFDELGEINPEGDNEGNGVLDSGMLGADKAPRWSPGALEVKAEAFPHTFFRR